MPRARFELAPNLDLQSSALPIELPRLLAEEPRVELLIPLGSRFSKPVQSPICLPFLVTVWVEPPELASGTHRGLQPPALLIELGFVRKFSASSANSSGVSQRLTYTRKDIGDTSVWWEPMKYRFDPDVGPLFYAPQSWFVHGEKNLLRETIGISPCHAYIGGHTFDPMAISTCQYSR